MRFNRFLNRFLAFSLACLTTANTAIAQDVASTVSLNTPQLWHLWEKDSPDKKQHCGSPLALEVTRQAILLSAREELGLRTFDASLGEPVKGEGVVPLELKLKMYAMEGADIELLRAGKSLVKHKIKCIYWHHPGIIESVKKHEAFSRNEAVKALRDSGLRAAPNKWFASAQVPKPIQKLVDEMSLVSQFRAARELHKLIRDEGESPERLWALSRVYANLGQECRWFIRHQFAVFQARSLLYAQRLSAKAPGHPLGELAQAYAWTLATYTRTAGKVLDRLEKKDLTKHKDWKAWSELIRACCNYDNQKLDGFIKAGGPRASTAALWNVVTHEFVEMKGMTFGAVKQAMEINPLSTRGLYGGYIAMGVSTGHWLTEMAPQHFAMVTNAQLQRIKQAPEPVLKLIGELDDNELSAMQLSGIALALNLHTAKGADPNEMSYGVLGTLIDEANALHVLYRAKFMRRQWGVDTTAYLREALPTFARHPYAPLILTFQYRSNSAIRPVGQLMGQFKPGYMNLVNLRTFVWHLPGDFKLGNGMSETQWFQKVYRMALMSGTDWFSRMRFSDEAHRGKLTNNMGAYDPHHPMRIALRVQHLKLGQKRLDSLVERYGKHPLVAHALADRFEREGNIKVAVKYAGIAAAAAPERKTVERQARLQLLLGNEAKWLELMKSILELPDHGLDHAAINRIIAGTYMNKGDFKGALPYSEQSARSFAAWALNTYMINLSVLGRQKEAVALGRQLNARYGLSYFSEQNIQIWAGTADATKMERLFEGYYTQKYARGKDASSIDWRMMYVHFALGRFQEVLDRIAARKGKWGTLNSRELLFGVVAAQHLGKDKLRDQLLGLLVNYKTDEKGNRYRFSLLADLMKQALKTGKVDWEAADKWTKAHDSEFEVEVGANLGIFVLKIPGERKEALARLKAVARYPDYTIDLVNTARSVLRKEGYTNKQMLPTGFKSHAWREKKK